MLAFALPSWLPVYLSRHYHLAPSHVGILVGLVLAIPAVLGFVCAGVVVDRLFVRGILNAHFRYSMFAILLLTVTGVAAMLVPGLFPCLAFVALTQFLFCITGPMIAHLQLVTPNQLRGRVSALYVAVFILVGVGLGSSIVAFFTDYIFRDTNAVGLSLASTFAMLGPIGVLASFLGLGAAREAVKATLVR
jgi:MFS family permease